MHAYIIDNSRKSNSCLRQKLYKKLKSGFSLRTCQAHTVTRTSVLGSAGGRYNAGGRYSAHTGITEGPLLSLYRITRTLRYLSGLASPDVGGQGYSVQPQLFRGA